MKRLYLLFHGRFPSEKASALFTAKNAQSFAKQGFEVIVVVPKRKNVRSETAFDYFNISRDFKIESLKTIDLFPISYLEWIAFPVSFIFFSLSCFFFLRRFVRKEDVVYSNESLPLYAATFTKGNTFYEMHDFPGRGLWFFRHFLKRVKWVLIHNKWKQKEAQEKFSDVDAEKFICEPNAVELPAFDLPVSKEEARSKVGLPLSKKIAVYTGHLYDWKGVDTLAEAANLLTPEFLVVFVGGTEPDIRAFRQKYGTSRNILIAGWKSHKEIPLWQKAADALIIPNTAKAEISLHYTSPMKLFEYMASKRPIIASDIPSIREIASEKMAFFVPPDNVPALRKAIEEITSSDTEALSQEAFLYVAEHTWDKRARRILSFMENNIQSNMAQDRNHEKGKISLPIFHKSFIFLSNISKAQIFLLIRYLFSGFLSFATNLVLLFIFKHYFHMWYLSASTLAFIISVIVSFLAQKFITFGNRSKKQVPRQFILYIAIALFNVFANGLFMFFFVEKIHIPYMIAQVFSAGFIAVWSFIVYRFIIFPSEKIL